MTRRKSVIIFIIVVTVLVLVDQLTKKIAFASLIDGNISIIGNFFYLQLVLNRGAAFGMLADHRILFCLISILAAVIIEIIYIKMPTGKAYMPLQISLMVLCAGAVGNLIDRIKYGYVIDFLAFDFGNYLFPRFNIADIYVTVSTAVLIVLILFYYKDEEKE